MKIGETFEQDGIEYIAKELENRDKPCTGCTFRHDTDGCNKSPRCGENDFDNDEVIYAEVE